MSGLDDDLKNALDAPTTAPEEAGGVVRDVSGAALRPSGAPSNTKRRWGLLIGLVFMGGAILFVVLSGIDNAAVYSKSVSQLLAERERLQKRNVRVVGHLVSGTLKRRSEPCEYRFRLTEGKKELEVHYPQCVVPDTFRDVPGVSVEVTAEGQLQKDGTFLSNHIMAKCPSKYDMNEKSKAGPKLHVTE